MQDLQQELKKDFILESIEGLEEFDQELLLLEKGGGGIDSIHRIFRVIHTIKGTGGCLGLTKIESLAHGAENLLVHMRETHQLPGPDRIAALLHLSDALKSILGELERTGTCGLNDYDEIKKELEQLLLEQSAGLIEPEQSKIPQTSITAAAGFGLFDEEETGLDATVKSGTAHDPSPFTDGKNSHKAGEEFSEAARFSDSSAGGISDSVIRVAVNQLDRLMNLVGELVLARNQILQYAQKTGDQGHLLTCQRLNGITTELQEGVMKTRMQPIGNIWAKCPRIIRDLAAELGKKVQLRMEGNQTELDRTIIEAIKDPLIHIIRNSIDHGIELPHVRLSKGKSETGTVHLKAFHEGGQVNIEIRDDGAGIHLDKIREKCRVRGLVSPEVLSRLSDREAMQLIFLPGLSTAEQVTNVSGRGVGMDVVKSNIEKIGGSVELQSEENVGTTLKLKIPLTLAIIHALILRSGSERFAIPQGSVSEVVRLEDQEVRSGVELIHSSPYYRLRGDLIPLVDLREQLRLEGKRDFNRETSLCLIVLKVENHRFGLVVDQIFQTEEIVVKPLGKKFKELQVYAGSTIMGDGRVALILDVLGLARISRILAESGQNKGSAQERPLRRDENDSLKNRQIVLLFNVGESRQMALPLSEVNRLEEMPSAQIEFVGQSEVIQYRETIMPLIRLSRVLKVTDSGLSTDGTLHVIVYNWAGQNIGLIVDRIIDIVESQESVKPCANRTGIIGSAVVRRKITEYLNMEEIVSAADIPLFNSPSRN